MTNRTDLLDALKNLSRVIADRQGMAEEVERSFAAHGNRLSEADMEAMLHVVNQVSVDINILELALEKIIMIREGGKLELANTPEAGSRESLKRVTRLAEETFKHFVGRDEFLDN